ncbi:hypothetical protein D3C71_1958980 [compost metagenome]
MSGEVSSTALAELAAFPLFVAFPAASPAALLPLFPPQPASMPSIIIEVSVSAVALAFIFLLFPIT